MRTVAPAPTVVERMGVRLEVGSNRVRAVQDWLGRRVDKPLGRLAWQWFRAYLQASRNSACAATIYASLSVLPTVLVALAYFHPTRGDANAFAERLVTHLKLTGATATLVQGTFGSASANTVAATLSVLLGFALWGLGVGQAYQDVYARAWGVKTGSIADQALFALFFVVVTGAIALALVSAAGLRAAGWLVLLPAWLVASTAFWLWTPRFLLHRAVAVRALLPGALLGAVAIGGEVALAPLFVAAPLNTNGRAFGAFGIAVTTIAYAFVIITTSLACAVFAPVWATWRETERERRDAPAGAASDRNAAEPERGRPGVP